MQPLSDRSSITSSTLTRSDCNTTVPYVDVRSVATLVSTFNTDDECFNNCRFEKDIWNKGGCIKCAMVKPILDTTYLCPVDLALIREFIVTEIFGLQSDADHYAALLFADRFSQLCSRLSMEQKCTLFDPAPLKRLSYRRDVPALASFTREFLRQVQDVYPGTNMALNWAVCFGTMALIKQVYSASKVFWIQMRKIYVDLGKTVTCPICTELFVSPYTTKCGHSFCKECLLKTYTNRLEMISSDHQDRLPCPTCRTPNQLSQLINNHALSSVLETFHKMETRMDLTSFWVFLYSLWIMQDLPTSVVNDCLFELGQRNDVLTWCELALRTTLFRVSNESQRGLAALDMGLRVAQAKGLKLWDFTELMNLVLVPSSQAQTIHMVMVPLVCNHLFKFYKDKECETFRRLLCVLSSR